jgi:hypothetical protein
VELKAIFISNAEKLKNTRNMVEMAKIAYEIAYIAKEMKKKGSYDDFERLEFSFQLFAVNLTFCGKAMQLGAVENVDIQDGKLVQQIATEWPMLEKTP